MPQSADILPHTIAGDDPRAPLVLIHGFAGDQLGWATVQPALAETRRTVTFDLPGHGHARDWPQTGNANVAANALIESLDALELGRVHLVGHSFGGAVATLIGLKRPEKVASLTLIAPGGFGPEVNGRLLRRFAAMTQEQEIAIIVEDFFGFESDVPDGLVSLMSEVRSDPRLIASFRAIVETLLDGGRQKTLPLGDLAEAPFPTKVIWGDQDHVVPVKQALSLPPKMARHILPGVGHMPHVEESELVVRLILENALGE